MEFFAKNKRNLLVLLALSPMSIAQAQSSKEATVPELETINALVNNYDLSYGKSVNATAATGILGNVVYMDNPYSVTSYTGAEVERQQSRSVGDFLGKIDPSINSMGNDTYAVELLTVRGLRISPQDTTVNGLAGMAGYHKVLLNGMYSMEMIKGPSAMLTGSFHSNMVGGNVNIITKRAEDDPRADLTLTYYTRSRTGVHADLGRRFGDKKQFGIRYNGTFRKGGGVRNHQEEKLALNSLSLDYKGEKTRLFLDAMANNADLTSYRGALMNSDVMGSAMIDGKLPDPPDGKTNLEPGWAKQRGQDRMIMGRAEFDINDSTMAYVSAGFAENKLHAPNTANWLTNRTQVPTATFGAYRPQHLADFNTKRETFSSIAGLNGRFTLGKTKHKYAIDMAYSRANEHTMSEYFLLSAECNTSTLYDVRSCSEPLRKNPYRAVDNLVKSTIKSIGFIDTISMFDDKLDLTLGVRWQKIDTFFDGHAKRTAKGVTTQVDTLYDVSKSAFTPTVGITVKPLPDLSIYGHYIEGLVSGQVAPATASNAGQVMDPYKTKQYEVGVKKEFGNWVGVVSLFNIERAFGLTNPTTNIYSADGKLRNRGLELNMFGEVTEGLRINAGMAWINSKLVNYDKKIYAGTDVMPAPKYSAKLNIEWDVPHTNQLTLLGSIIHNGKATINGIDFYTGKLGKATVPAWTRVDLGLMYQTKIMGKKTTLQATVENVFNKRYWTVGDFNNSQLTVLDHAAPRTFLLSVKTEF